MKATKPPLLPVGTKVLILFLLHRRRDRDTHGLLLAGRLGVTPATAYRHLRQLADDGLVSSSMEEVAVPVARALQRQHRITKAGIEVVHMLCSFAGIHVPTEEADHG